MKPQNWRFWHWQPFKGKHLWFCGCSKCALRCAFFPSVALARSYQDFNELSAKKTCWPSSKRVNWTSILSVIYLSKRFFTITIRLSLGFISSVVCGMPSRFGRSGSLWWILVFHSRSIVCGPTNNLRVWKSERKLKAFTWQFCAYAPKGNE